MLTLHLRQLEQEGIVQRTVHLESVLRTEYSLTDYGRTLLPALEELSKWGKKHRLFKRQ